MDLLLIQLDIANGTSKMDWAVGFVRKSCEYSGHSPITYVAYVPDS